MLQSNGQPAGCDVVGQPGACTRTWPVWAATFSDHVMPLQVQVRCWEIQANGTSVPKAAHAHDQPVLASGWNADGSCVFSGGCDKTVKMWNLATNQQQVSRHRSTCVYM